MMELSIEHLRSICSKQNIEITIHAAKRLEQRGILLNDIINCINSGEIIEQYPSDYPYPSCLILGLTVENRHLHVVIGSDEEIIWIITAYYPDTHKWNNDVKTRRK